MAGDLRRRHGRSRIALASPASPFDILSPQNTLRGLELNYGLEFTGSLMPYPSYVNRVYGVETPDGVPYVAKFYRPGRWSYEAVGEEHAFIADCSAGDIPVAVPLETCQGTTVGEMVLADPAAGTEEEFFFALFPRMGGRQFDAEGDDDWLRLGSLLGRLHRVGRQRTAAFREVCSPELTRSQAQGLLSSRVIHPESEKAFGEVCRVVLDRIGPCFRDIENFRIHGDCHRGNILDRPGEGLLFIDFDDMMTGPAVQDLWLLLPSYAEDSLREINLLLEGYETFQPFQHRELRLLEPLRFMRMIYYLAWCAQQRHDKTFLKHFPGWGSRTFWVKEVEDLILQAERVDAWLGRYQ